MPLLSSGEIRSVQLTRELSRVVNLPRRVWTEEEAAQAASKLTSLLKRPLGTQELRPIQGQALLEAGIKGGLFAPIRVGGGKTLLSLLAPYVIDSRRPLLVMPAKLIEKTKRAMRFLASHWLIPNFIRIISYEWMGRVQAQDFLDKEYQPDLIVFDEVHKVKNRKAAVTRRFERYFSQRPHTKCVAMSGTATKRSIKDWSHIARWCLGPNQVPVPNNWPELEDWADAIDEKTTGQRIEMGYLVALCNDEEKRLDPAIGVKAAFGRRVVETPGIVASRDSFLGCSLIIESKEIPVRKPLEDAFETLRKKWRTPDDWPITDPLSYWRTARELAMGFFNRWEPRPPDEWLAARREWSKACRELLENNKRRLDSPLMIWQAVREGKYPDVSPILEEWQRIEPSFRPNPSPVWIDDSVVDAAAIWAAEAPGIIWCEHVPLAERLAKRTKLAYYGKKGLDARGRAIEDHPAGESLIASEASNAEGRDLQKWHRNLITSCPANGLRWEQILGRTHRDGQEADEVEFTVFVTAIEHVRAFDQACKDAVHVQLVDQKDQKLCYADKTFLTEDEVITRPGFRWSK